MKKYRTPIVIVISLLICSLIFKTYGASESFVVRFFIGWGVADFNLMIYDLIGTIRHVKHNDLDE
tara:strand:- start:1711 stop:1905 length:195 start_codon:yes stop_codon:yes gene_type:complete